MKRLLGLLLAALLVLCALLLVAKLLQARSPSPPQVDIQTILAQLEPISELSTLRAHVSGVVTARQKGAYAWQGTSRMVLIVRGQALYSCDLSKADIRVAEDHVRIVLPEPRLMDAWVDVDRSVLWERVTGWLRSGDDTELDEAAWKAAKEMVANGARDGPALQRAREEAERVIQRLVAKASPGLELKLQWKGA